MITLLLVAALAPPSPPGFHEKWLTPKAQEEKVSWGQRMVKSQTVQPQRRLSVAPPFIITNISIIGGSNLLSWSGGQAPFQIDGEPTLQGPWSTVLDRLTMAHSAMFHVEQNRFWRVLQNQPIPVSITSTNPQTIKWETSTLDMSDSLSSFVMQRQILDVGTTPPILPVGDPNYDTGWDDCPSGVSPCPISVDPNLGTQTNPYVTTDPMPPPANKVVYYRPKEITANGVRIPYGWTAAANQPLSGVLVLRPILSANNDIAQACCSDSTGNIYLTGFEKSGGTEGFWFVQKYSTSGTLAWTTKWEPGPGQPGVTGIPYGIFVHTDGTVWLTGTTESGGNFGLGVLQGGITIAKFSQSGSGLTPLLTASFPAAVTSLPANIGYAIAVNSAGDPAITGQFHDVNFGGGHSFSDTDGAIFVAKFSGTDLSCSWANAYKGGNAGLGKGIGFDSLGNVVFGGVTSIPTDFGGGTKGSFNNVFAVKLQDNGNSATHVWSNVYGCNSSVIGFNGLAVAPNNDVGICGYFGGAGGVTMGTLNLGGSNLTANPQSQNDPFFARYDSSGNHIWSKHLGQPDATGNGPPPNNMILPAGSVYYDLSGGAAYNKITNTGTSSDWVFRPSTFGTAVGCGFDSASNMQVGGICIYRINYGNGFSGTDALGIYVARYQSGQSTPILMPQYPYIVGTSGNQVVTPLGMAPRNSFPMICGKWTGTNVDFGTGPLSSTLNKPFLLQVNN